ncbi:hypothetical protein EV137_1825 [Kribbella pratensis]|uniref:Uncharacterized protein n=1 Tax=Kribbella pratensis TaxID=2512112 RepID=A0ABY2FPK3_9ACTN|nr:hypothetical protein [Kribbella pratensis]TDW94510.1 hypothetical protein EV137_1825 [Kribbella pratensis]
MKLRRFALVLTGFGLLAASSTTAATAAAAPGSAVAAAATTCWNSVVWPTKANVVDTVDVTARKPPAPVSPPYVYSKFFASRFMDRWYLAWNAAGTQYYAFGLFLLGSNLYRQTTVLSGGSPAQSKAVRVGTGWASFKSIATSNYPLKGSRPAYLYGLNSNGNLYRYAPNGAGYRSAGSFAGFRGFKTMTMISEERTYDTLLMTTTAGALYTIHIPTTASAKPVVKLIRKSGWAAYESLVVNKCGVNGATVIIAVDHDTQSGYQYGFSKFNGTATAMTSYGKVPVVFNGLNHTSQIGFQFILLGE